MEEEKQYDISGDARRHDFEKILEVEEQAIAIRERYSLMQ